MVNKKEEVNLNKLTALDILNKNKSLDATDEFLISIDGDDFMVTHDVIFRKTKQQKVLEDMIKFFNEIDSFNAELLEMVTPYVSLLIIKHFTSLDVPEELEDAMNFLTALIDLGVLGKIINELPQDEVVKVFELLTETIDNIRKNVEEAEAEALEASEKVEEKVDEVDGEKE